MSRQKASIPIETAIEIWQSHYHRNESDYQIAERMGLGLVCVETTIIGRKYSDKPCRRCKLDVNRQTPFGTCMACWLKERAAVDDMKDRRRRRAQLLRPRQT